jgi:carbon-monoxide dehydrogenase large subunit
MTATSTRIGDSARRVEDHRFLTGRGQYVDDIRLPGMAHAVVIQSPYAHAKILAIDTLQALNLPGVLCVLTGAELQQEGLGGMPPLFMPEDMGGPKGYRTYRPLLAVDKVRCVGDRVAMIVAETAAIARDAAELVEVEYQALDAVVSVEAAAQEDAPQLWDEAPGNRCCMVAYGDEAATQKAFERAPHVVRVRLESNRLSANSLEPRGAIGQFNSFDDTFTLHTSSQNPHGARTMLCTHVFRIPETRMRVISPDVGGGFGMKADAYPEDGLVLAAARRCGRPVKWVPTRSESLAGDNHGRDQVVEAEMALDAAAKILGGPRAFAPCVRRLRRFRCRAPAELRGPFHPKRLRRAGLLRDEHRHLHEHVAHRPVSRGWASGSRLRHRTPHGRGGTGARDRPGPDSPTQPHPA